MVVYYHVLDMEKNGIRFTKIYNANRDWCGQLKTTPVFINVQDGRDCYVNRPTANLILG